MLPALSHHSPWSLLDPLDLLQPSVDSNLKITSRSFQHAAPHLWNKVPFTLRVPYQSGASSTPSSSPSLCSDPGPIVDMSHGVLHSCLGIFRQIGAVFFPTIRWFFYCQSFCDLYKMCECNNCVVIGLHFCIA